ncbi:dTDP-4-dehydrorhamnose reductase [Rhodoplanes elegans]|uniref:dTDP-4-dehydrorhamnose reductase n=1 Tax=Rhodoplanes elegans TaxID=29408 RepID=A0A327KKT7_9BRAD|nr:dTDP-4-dehydrorhamnose reductase [Rhodoplanes elegans]MBK5956883.1 dTDP-4-dehydrorhamnose reductase [Rhodoplanes elegans]RAI38075.1 dTDP-4-dehydrorhamnose reductase [Rhodoplanes elegans]
MKILLLGGTGQLGRESLLRAGPGLRIVAPTRRDLDLAQPETIAAYVAGQDVDVIVNAAAYTAVDKAESEPDLAFVLNAEVPGRLAAAAAAKGVPLVHVSTDYVFDGTKGAPYLPSDPVAPLGVYGASKEAGERAVRAAGGRAVVLRTAWVYGPFGGNFMKTMLRLARERDVLCVVDDQRGTPTASADLAAACLTIAARLVRDPEDHGGTFHFTNAGETTWCGFARAIVEIAGPRLAKTPEVVAIATADYPTPAERPADSRLDCAATLARYQMAQPDWRAALAATLDRLPEEVFRS